MMFESELRLPTSLPTEEEEQALVKHLRRFAEQLKLDPVEFEIAG